VATANAVRYTGATPIFADISSERDLNISPNDIESRITKHTRAIIVVHYGGYACDMVHIMELAREHDLYVIEDAAHAIGSELIERRLGTWGDIGCFSFFSNKNLTTGEGGLVVTAQVEIAEKLRLLRSHGMTSLTWDRHRGHAWSYDVVALGYNYRIDEIRAALGLVQLGKLDQYNARRRHLTQQYYSLLHELTPNIIIPFESHPGLSAAHIMPVLLPKGHDRHRLMEQMKARGIQTSIHYPPIHTFTAYKNQDRPDNFHLPLTDDIATREVTLPLYPALTEEDIATVVFAARDALLN
jgi:dTDP-4-amino-4,6-dideoxygalactose transaminase